MEYYSSHINKLIEQFSHLPGIGAKSAQRLAFHIMNMPKEQVQQLTNAITDARMNVQYCKCCYTLTDKEMCPICSNPKRDHSTIMVVENTRDLAAYEKTGKFDGVYHVLHGAISPMLGKAQFSGRAFHFFHCFSRKRNIILMVQNHGNRCLGNSRFLCHI